MKKVQKVKYLLYGVLIAVGFFLGFKLYHRWQNENAVLKQVITRLEAQTRVAEVLVTGVNYDEKNKKAYTTIKFLEYDEHKQPLKPRYFTFIGNIIQFQALIIRFDNIHIRNGHKLKGKSAHIFWKAFVLDGENTQEFEINKLNEIPQGYKIEGLENPFELKLWQEFWAYALNPDLAKTDGIRNAQIEAPGTMFVPGHLYTIYIEHDGGLLIDSSPLSPILKGETILK
ncbi:MAG: hypothetical protein H6755_03410 [Candidatus Omnitrophica bacterium]|nr:hypothetical protein [Candidatus Omnitrophota bacterium]MCB9747435.1 hypothetical protein [Candidatus Omnitrophota bacterium]